MRPWSWIRSLLGRCEFGVEFRKGDNSGVCCFQATGLSTNPDVIFLIPQQAAGRIRQYRHYVDYKRNQNNIYNK